MPLETCVSASHSQAVQCHPVECSDAAQGTIYGKNGGEISVYSCVNFSELQEVLKAPSYLQVREDALCCLILGRGQLLWVGSREEVDWRVSWSVGKELFIPLLPFEPFKI